MRGIVDYECTACWPPIRNVIYSMFYMKTFLPLGFSNSGLRNAIIASSQMSGTKADMFMDVAMYMFTSVILFAMQNIL